MSHDEFLLWMEYHTSTFPDWGRQVSQLQSRTVTLNSWRKAFGTVSLASAKQATDEMLAGQHEPLEYGLQGHVTNISKRAREIDVAKKRQAMRFDEEPRRRCVHCTDSGLVQVVDNASADDEVLSRMAVWCGCERGEYLKRAEDERRAGGCQHVPPRESPVYDPDVHVRWRYDQQVMREELGRIKPANYERSFDDWNTEAEA